jgi:hypothetical protein
VLARWGAFLPESVFWLLMLLVLPAVSLAAESDVLGFIFGCEFSLLLALFGPIGAAGATGGRA